MFIEGLSDWEKRRLALILKERGYTAFMVIKHATAAILSAKRGRLVNTVDNRNLTLLDTIVEELYGFRRLPNDLHYVNANPVAKDSQSSTN